MIFHNTTRLIQGCLIAVAMLLPLGSKADNKNDLSSNPESKFNFATNTTDSIKLLLDVYNEGSFKQRKKVRNQLIRLASKTDNNEIISDVIKELATSTDDTTELSRLIEISETLPEGEQNKTLQTVLQMEQADAQASTIHDSQLKEQLTDYRRQGMTISGDPYKEIQNVYRTMVYLGASSQGAMYYGCIKRLEGLIDNIPDEDYAIKNLFFTNAALFYTRKGDYKKAIEYDRKLLHELDGLKALYKKQGKDTTELDYFYYVSNRRLLRNFPGLSDNEIQQVYDTCVRLAENDERVQEEFDEGGLTKSYYYMATGQYSKAVPELKKALASSSISDIRRRELLGHLSTALRNTGDKNSELEALRQYSGMMEKERQERLQQLYKEIELRKSVNKVIYDEMLQQEQQKEENKVMRKTSITLVYVLAVILIFMCQAYFRMRHKLKELEFKNNKLRKNIEYIFDDGVPKGTQDLRHKKNRLKG